MGPSFSLIFHQIQLVIIDPEVAGKARKRKEKRGFGLNERFNRSKRSGASRKLRREPGLEGCGAVNLLSDAFLLFSRCSGLFCNEKDLTSSACLLQTQGLCFTLFFSFSVYPLAFAEDKTRCPKRVKTRIEKIRSE